MAFRIIEHTISSFGGFKRPLETNVIEFCDKLRADRRVSWLRREFGAENIALRPVRGQLAVAEVFVRVD